jgi:hypothetical protein
MVAFDPERQDELAALIRAQADDEAHPRVRHRGAVSTATDLGLILDRLPSRRRGGVIIVLEGRTHEWASVDPPDSPCPVCDDTPGDWCVCPKCLRADPALEPVINQRGRPVDHSIGGPTVYDPEDDGLRGGVGQ